MVKKKNISASAGNPCTPAINSLATAPAPTKILRLPVKPSPAKKKVNWDHHHMCVGEKAKQNGNYETGSRCFEHRNGDFTQKDESLMGNQQPTGQAWWLDVLRFSGKKFPALLAF
jgi:hypothetical protein